MLQSAIKTVLVVEDELPLQKAVGQKFERKGMQASGAQSVDQALAVLNQKGRVDLIWLDHYLLGRGTGLDLVKVLKEKEDWSNIPVVLVSNTASIPKMQEYQSNGVNKCYVKSEHSLDEIFGDIDTMLKKE